MLVTLCFEQLNVVLHEKPSKHVMNHYVLVNDYVVYQDEWHEWCSIDSTKAKHLGVCEVSHPMMRVESACYIAKTNCGITLFQGGNWWDGGAKLSRILWGQLRFWASWRRQNKNQKSPPKKGGESWWIRLGIRESSCNRCTGYVIYYVYIYIYIQIQF